MRQAGLIVQPVTRDQAVRWTWMHGMAGTLPSTPARDDNGHQHGVMLRGSGWRLVYLDCGKILLAADADLPAVAFLTEEKS